MTLTYEATRRTFISQLAAAGAALPMFGLDRAMAADSPRMVPQRMRAADTLQAPSFEMPAGAVDAHMHIFGALDRYPSIDNPFYDLPDGNLEQYLAVMRQLKIARFVIVQPSFYGTDNRCLIDTLARVGDIARGIVMVDPQVDDEVLQKFDAAGVRGVRLDLFKYAQHPPAEIQSYIQSMIRKVAPLGWHVQLHGAGTLVRDLLGFLETLESDYVLDHMGYMVSEDGVTDRDISRLLDLAKQGRCWIKLSGSYRLAAKAGMAQINEVAQAIVAAAPERVLWGSDWPHIPWGGMDTGALLNLLPSWASEPALRKLILRDNPSKLFGFANH